MIGTPWKKEKQLSLGHCLDIRGSDFFYIVLPVMTCSPTKKVRTSVHPPWMPLFLDNLDNLAVMFFDGGPKIHTLFEYNRAEPYLLEIYFTFTQICVLKIYIDPKSKINSLPIILKTRYIIKIGWFFINHLCH